MASARAGGTATRSDTSSRTSTTDAWRRGMRLSPGSAAPDETRDLGHALELAALILRRDAVAFHGRGEAALPAQGQALERLELGRLLDAPPQLRHRLQPRFLRGHETQNDLAIGRHEAQRLEVARAIVVVLQEEALETALANDARDWLVAAARVELRLVVAAADVQTEGHARVMADHGVVHLDAGVDQPVGIAAARDVAGAQRRIKQGRILGRVDLDVHAAEPDQLLDLAAIEIHDVGQVGVARRVGARGLPRVIVGGRLLGAEQRDLRRLRGARAQVRELLAAHAAPPRELLDHDRTLEDELLALLVAERDGPPPVLVEAREGLDHVAEERIASQLAVGDDVEAGCFLEPDSLVHRAVLDPLERRRGQPSRFQRRARLGEVRGPQETADHVAARTHGGADDTATSPPPTARSGHGRPARSRRCRRA